MKEETKIRIEVISPRYGRVVREQRIAASCKEEEKEITPFAIDTLKMEIQNWMKPKNSVSAIGQTINEIAKAWQT